VTDAADLRDPFAQPQTYREALAVHEGLRRLGFPSDNISVSFASDLHGPDVFHVVLHMQGLPEFTIPVGQLKGVEEKLVYETWIALTTAVVDGTTSDETLARIWADSRVAKSLLSLTAALIVKGLVPPIFDKLPDAALESVVNGARGVIASGRRGFFFGLACVECDKLMEVCELPIWEASGKSMLALPEVLQAHIGAFLGQHDGHQIVPQEFEITSPIEA
jgi:hypothetical protein